MGKRSRPETPLLKWKVNEAVKDAPVEDDSVTELTRKNVRKINKKKDVLISARKLAAGLWRLQLPEAPRNVGNRLENEQLGLQVFFLIKFMFFCYVYDLSRNVACFRIKF